jgi:hypothetical protein
MFGCSSHVDLNSDVCQGRSMGGERGWHFASIAELISLITRSVVDVARHPWVVLLVL